MLDRLRESLLFFIGNFGRICVIVIPFALPLNIFSDLYYSYFLTEETHSFLLGNLPYSIYLLVNPIYSGALIWYFSKTVLEDAWDWNLRECLSAGFRFWPQMITVSVFCFLLITVGLFAFILPGIVLIARFAFAEFMVVIEGDTAADAIKKSVFLTRSFQIDLMSNFVLLIVIIGGSELGAVYLIDKIFPGNILLSVGVKTIFAVFLELTDVMFFRYYCLLKEQTPKGNTAG